MKTNKFFTILAIGIISAALATSCKEKEDDLPPIGGYNNADEVGAADLVAHWPLNSDLKEMKSATMPDATLGESFVDGIKGKALKLTSGYVSYPEIPALSTTTGSMTLSLWAKISNNGGDNGFSSVLFTMSREEEWAGNINLMAETGWFPATSDTLVMKGLAVIKNTDGSGNWQDIINSVNPSEDDVAAGHVAAPNKNAGVLTHYVLTWEATTGMFKLYANGVKISNPVWESRGGGNELALNFFAPTHPVIGAFATVVTGTTEPWQKGLIGEIDEIRVWKKALASADIMSLYELEKAGR